MASTLDFTIAGDPGNARNLVVSALASLGHQVHQLADGTLAVTRGSGGMTFLVGGLAGSGFHTRFTLAFYDTPNGTVARFSSVGALGGLKGGIIGAQRTTEIFNEAARQIDATARYAGLLVGVAQY